jgi:ATP-dependent DNA ligase
MVFDLAQLRMPIEARHAALGRLHLPPWVQLVEHRPCLSQDDLDATEAATVQAGGEGLVLRERGSFYRPGNFIKCKRLTKDLDRSILD